MQRVSLSAALIVGAVLALAGQTPGGNVFATRVRFDGGPVITSGAADPESSVAAPAGSFYLRTNGTPYRKASGSGNTGWSSLLTVSVVVPIPIGVCREATAELFFSVTASGTAPTADCIAGTNVITAAAGFDDDGAERQVQFSVRLPTDWTGAIDLAGVWRSADTSGSVVWQVATICVADAETSDPAWNAAQAIIDAAKGTTLQQNTFSQASLTTTGCAAGETLYVKVFRDSDHASDDLASATDGIAQLLAIELTLRRAM